MQRFNVVIVTPSIDCSRNHREDKGLGLFLNDLVWETTEIATLYLLPDQIRTSFHESGGAKYKG